MKDDDDALSRAKRALQVVPGGAAAAPVDKANIDDLLKRARDVSRTPPAVIEPSRTNDLLARAKASSRPAEPRPAATATPDPLPCITRNTDDGDGNRRVLQFPARTPERVREAPRNPPPAIAELRRVVPCASTPAAPRPVEIAAQPTPAPVQQTVVVQVAAPYPVYPYPYPWRSYPGPCLSLSCPLRFGRPCSRWGCW